MARCNDCNKFCALEQEEPDFGDIDVERTDEPSTVKLSGSCEIILDCVECGSPVKTGMVELVGVEVKDERLAEHLGPIDPENEESEDHELEIECVDVETVQSTVGKGARAKTRYGVHATFQIECSCQKLDTIDVEWTDDGLTSSEMDDA